MQVAKNNLRAQIWAKLTWYLIQCIFSSIKNHEIYIKQAVYYPVLSHHVKNFPRDQMKDFCGIYKLG